MKCWPEIPEDRIRIRTRGWIVSDENGTIGEGRGKLTNHLGKPTWSISKSTARQEQKTMVLKDVRMHVNFATPSKVSGIQDYRDIDRFVERGVQSCIFFVNSLEPRTVKKVLVNFYSSFRMMKHLKIKRWTYSRRGFPSGIHSQISRMRKDSRKQTKWSAGLNGTRLSEDDALLMNFVSKE